MSTTYNPENGYIYSGFLQKNEYKVGIGINDGYTEYLTSKMLNDGLNNIYPYELAVASIVENVIGKEKMENFYFSTDLKSLINELGKYSNDMDVKKFIFDLDYMNRYGYNEILFRNQVDLLHEIRSRVNNFLININEYKLKEKLNKGFISNEQYLQQMKMVGQDIQKAEEIIKKYNNINNEYESKVL